MTNLKSKILNFLDNKKQTKPILQDLLESQNNLLKNYSNPVIKEKDKIKILKEYEALQDIGKLLYRYNIFKEHNYLNNANTEKENARDIIIKTGISYNKYVWHSENGEHTCEVCTDLDGQEFDFYDEIPECPHPNCRCYVEIVEDDDKNPSSEKNKNEEPCDAIDEINAIIKDIESGIQKTENISDKVEILSKDLETDTMRVQNLIQETDSTLEILGDEYGKHLPDCENNVDADYTYMYAKRAELLTLLNDILGLLNPIRALANTLRIFISNYFKLLYHAYILREKEMDKYYHSKANCEATQEIGIIGEKSAEFLSNAKELYDQYTYVHTHKVTIEEAIADSEKDQIANKLGRERGRKYPYCDCSILMYDLLPDYKK